MLSLVRVRYAALCTVVLTAGCVGGSAHAGFSSGLPQSDRIDRFSASDATQFCAALVPFASSAFGVSQSDVELNCVLAGWVEATLVPSRQRQTVCEQARIDCLDGFANDARVQMPELSCNPAELSNCHVTVGDYEACINAYDSARFAARQAAQGVSCENAGDFIRDHPVAQQPQSQLDAEACTAVRQRCPNFFSLLN